MIEGLRFLPRVQAERERLMEDGAPLELAQQVFLDCDSCTMNRDERASIRCGWLPESSWTDGSMPLPGATICPGYTTSLPEVYEAARLLRWVNRGALGAYTDQLPLSSAAALAVDLLEDAVRATERDALRRMKAEREAGHGTR